MSMNPREGPNTNGCASCVRIEQAKPAPRAIIPSGSTGDDRNPGPPRFATSIRFATRFLHSTFATSNDVRPLAASSHTPILRAIRSSGDFRCRSSFTDQSSIAASFKSHHEGLTSPEFNRCLNPKSKIRQAPAPAYATRCSSQTAAPRAEASPRRTAGRSAASPPAVPCRPRS